MSGNTDFWHDDLFTGIGHPFQGKNLFGAEGGRVSVEKFLVFFGGEEVSCAPVFARNFRLAFDRLAVSEERDRVVALDGHTGFVEIEKGFGLGKYWQGQPQREEYQWYFFHISFVKGQPINLTKICSRWFFQFSLAGSGSNKPAASGLQWFKASAARHPDGERETSGDSLRAGINNELALKAVRFTGQRPCEE
jgi:hypothetical protein